MTIAATSIADLRNRVVLCTMHDVVDVNGSMALSREEVVETWARIRPFVSFGSKGAFLSRETGFAVLDPNLHQSHWIAIRAQHDLDITAAAWVYEKRRKTTARWYKVLGFNETEKPAWINIAVHLHQKTDSSQPVRGDLSPMQNNVAL